MQGGVKASTDDGSDDKEEPAPGTSEWVQRTIRRMQETQCQKWISKRRGSQEQKGLWMKNQMIAWLKSQGET